MVERKAFMPKSQGWELLEDNIISEPAKSTAKYFSNT